MQPGKTSDGHGHPRRGARGSRAVSLALALALAAAAPAGCNSGKGKIRGDLRMVDFHIEVSPNLPPPHSESVTIPVGNETLSVDPKAILTQYDLRLVQLVKAETPEDGTPILLYRFHLTPEAARRLYRLTAQNRGRRIVTKINGKPVSVDYIRGTEVRGFWETPTRLDMNHSLELLEKLVATTQQVSEELRKQDKTWGKVPGA